MFSTVATLWWPDERRGVACRALGKVKRVVRVASPDSVGRS